MSFLHHFTFHDPWWLLLLLPTLLLFLIRGKEGSPTHLTFSSLSILASLSSKTTRHPLRPLLTALLPFALLLGILALARPQWNNHYTTKEASGIDIVIALDISYSMSITDFDSEKSAFNRRRIDAAKEVIATFIKNRPNDRIGLVAFAGRPYPGSPITLDHDWLLSSLHKLNLGAVKEGGTAIGSAIAASAKRLDTRKSKSKIIVLVTDGASNSGRLPPIDAAKLAAQLDIKIYTMAIGTKDGRVNRGIQSFPQQEFDEPTLKTIAKLTQAEYYRARDTASLRDTFQTINKLEKSSAKIQQTTISKELYPHFTGASLLLLTLSLLATALNPDPAP